MSTEGQAKPAEALAATIQECIDYAESGSLRGKPAGWHRHMVIAAKDALRELAALASPKQSAAETKTEPVLPVEPPQELEQFICNCDIRSRARYTREGDNDFPGWKVCYRQMRTALAEGRGVSEQAVPLTDEQLADIANKGFDAYWTEDCAGSDSEAWAASAKAVIRALATPAPEAVPADREPT